MSCLISSSLARCQRSKKQELLLLSELRLMHRRNLQHDISAAKTRGFRTSGPASILFSHGSCEFEKCVSYAFSVTNGKYFVSGLENNCVYLWELQKEDNLRNWKVLKELYYLHAILCT